MSRENIESVLIELLSLKALSEWLNLRDCDAKIFSEFILITVLSCVSMLKLFCVWRDISGFIGVASEYKYLKDQSRLRDLM